MLTKIRELEEEIAKEIAERQKQDFIAYLKRWRNSLKRLKNDAETTIQNI